MDKEAKQKWLQRRLASQSDPIGSSGECIKLQSCPPQLCLPLAGHLLEVASYIVLEIEGGSMQEAPAECLLNEPKVFLHILGNYRKILKKIKVKVAPSCLTLGDPMGYIDDTKDRL